VHAAGVALAATGTAIMIASALAAVAAPTTFARLHYVTPLTSLGGPLLAVGLSVDSGANLTTASILLPTALLFLCGPILTAAVGRAVLQREVHSESESPD